MFPLIFEVLPRQEIGATILTSPRCCDPELDQNRRLHRQHPLQEPNSGRLDSVPVGLADEKVFWCACATRMRHHEVQQKRRDEILADYHLRVGQIAEDNQIPGGYSLAEQRLDETEVGEGTGRDLDQTSRTRPSGRRRPTRMIVQRGSACSRGRWTACRGTSSTPFSPWVI